LDCPDLVIAIAAMVASLSKRRVPFSESAPFVLCCPLAASADFPDALTRGDPKSKSADTDEDEDECAASRESVRLKKLARTALLRQARRFPEVLGSRFACCGSVL
jgi:hypothetical protein